MSSREVIHVSLLCLQIFKKMVGTMHHCHELGVMHRDLKPENFLLTSKVMGFGGAAPGYSICITHLWRFVAAANMLIGGYGSVSDTLTSTCLHMNTGHAMPPHDTMLDKTTAGR